MGFFESEATIENYFGQIVIDLLLDKRKEYTCTMVFEANRLEKYLIGNLIEYNKKVTFFCNVPSYEFTVVG